MPRYNTEHYSTDSSSISEMLKYAIIIAMAATLFIGGITIFTDPSRVELSRLTVPSIFGQVETKEPNKTIGDPDPESHKLKGEARSIEPPTPAKGKENIAYEITDQKGKSFHQENSSTLQSEHIDEKKIDVAPVAELLTTPKQHHVSSEQNSVQQIGQADPTIDEVMGAAFAPVQAQQNRYTYEEVMEHSAENVRALNAINRYFE